MRATPLSRLSSSGQASTLARALASHLIDARGTVEPNVDPKGVESRLRDGVFLWLDIDNPADCLAKFRSNRVVGWLLFGGILAGHFS